LVQTPRGHEKPGRRTPKKVGQGATRSTILRRKGNEGLLSQKEFLPGARRDVRAWGLHAQLNLSIHFGVERVIDKEKVID